MLLVFLLLADLARDPSEWHARGMAHIASGEFGEARVCFNRAIESDPRSPALRINLGNVLVKLGRRAEAIKQFHAALSSDPQQISALFNLATVYLDDGKPERALPLLARAMGLRPQDDEIQKQHLLALVRAGNPARVGRALEALGVAKCSLAMGIGKELAVRHHFSIALDTGKSY